MISKERKRQIDKKYRDNNKDKIKAKHKQYVSANKQKVKDNQKVWYENNRERLLIKAKENRVGYRDTRNAKERHRRRTDPVYRLRTNMSKLIGHKLKRVNSSKSGSICKYLSYSFDDLKNHLESQFEPWMNWNNYGKYCARSWNDYDRSTWTWQVDHIIPQSQLPYADMSDDNFIKCWSLDNLRPLSAKVNVIIGASLGKARQMGSA